MTLKEPPPLHEGLFLPIEEDSLLFQICFYYGLLVVLVEVVVPLLFQRRLRLFLPNVLPLAPLLSDDAFQHQKTQLSTQLRELQRASSAAKKKKQQQRRRKSVDTAGLSDKKKTPISEGTAWSEYSASYDASFSELRSGIRLPSSVRAQSTGKSAKSSVSSASRAREFEARKLEQGVSAIAEGNFRPSKLQQPSRSFFASTSSATQGVSAIHGVTDVTSSSAPSSRQSSRERRPPERQPSTGGTGAKASITDTQQRQVQREMRRYSWQREAAEGDDDVPASKLSQPSLSYSSTRRDISDDSSEKQRTYELSDQRDFETAEMEPQQEFRREEPTEFTSARYDTYDYDEAEETLPSELPKRSIAPFAPTQQSIFDDSDEEFLTVIRRPRSPVPMAPNRTFTSFGNEQMDVERTISAAFGGRPLGGGAAVIPTTHYQPAIVAPPVAAATPYYQVNMYEQPQAQARPQQQQQQQQQQRNQFITSRRETPDARNHRQEEAFGTTNYREVARDRTPKIIRKIAFDEEMMALAATPDANAAAGAKRKRSKIFSPEDEAQDFSRRRTRL